MFKGVFLWWRQAGIGAWLVECLGLFLSLFISFFNFEKGISAVGWLFCLTSILSGLSLIKRSLFSELIAQQSDSSYQRFLRWILRVNWAIVVGGFVYASWMIMGGRLHSLSVEDRALWVLLSLACAATVTSGLVVYAPALYFIRRNRIVFNLVLLGVLCLISAVGLGWMPWRFALLLGMGGIGSLPFTSAYEGFREFREEQVRLQNLVTRPVSED